MAVIGIPNSIDQNLFLLLSNRMNPLVRLVIFGLGFDLLKETFDFY